jgi:tryptophanyl-tRNA synthetase
MTGELKKICIETLTKFVTDFQDRKSKITKETVAYYMDKDRKIDP